MKIHKNIRTINIFMLIDALGWMHIKSGGFLEGLCPYRQRVKSVLGYSCGVIPSILTGASPSEHGRFTLFYYSPETSPFKWTKYLLWLPDKVIENRFARKIVEAVSKYAFNYKGYFETYVVPVKSLHLFDIPEKYNAYNENAFRDTQSIFDVWKKAKTSYMRYYYTSRDEDILKDAEADIKNNRASNYFLYLSNFDHFLHVNCDNALLIRQRLAWYENKIRSLYKTAKEAYDDVRISVFSDHGMASTKTSFDLKKMIDGLGFKMPGDYAAVYDSTMARFWFFNNEARSAIQTCLSKISFGRILSEKELKALGVNFKDARFGQMIFLMDAGNVILPSFMGNTKPSGMHGFHPNNKWMDASFLSNYKPGAEIKDIRDFFKVMTQTSNVDQSALTRNRKIKVLYFLNSTVRAGVEEHVLQLIDRLDKKRFEPLLVCPQGLIDLLKGDLGRMHARYYPICIRRWRHIKAIASFLKVLRDEKPDIVHTHLFFASFFAAPISKVAGIKTVVETAHLREAWRRGLKRAFFVDRFFYGFVDKIISVSSAVEGFLVKDKKLPNSKISVIRNGVDLDKFRPVSKKIANGKYNIGVIGRLEPQKGHTYLLDAIRAMEEGHDNKRYFIVGDGALKNELKSKSKDLNLNDKIEFMGFRNDIQNVIAEMDLIVLPSLYEGLPLVALESQAMGKPMIATLVDGTPEVIINNKTGILIPPGDSEAIKCALQYVFNNRDRVSRMGDAARRHVESTFNICKQITKTEELYTELYNLKNGIAT
ncbi:glycosyltransferase [Candidatus Omnitrophota bacterium]